MKKQSVQKKALGLVGLFSALVLTNLAGQSPVHAEDNAAAAVSSSAASASSASGSSVKLQSSVKTPAASNSQSAISVTQTKAAATVAEAAFQLTNHHADTTVQSTANNRAMGSVLSEQALAALTDETGSTKTNHILRMPAGLDEATSAKWLAIAKQQATKDRAATGRSQQIIMVAATEAKLKRFAIGDTSVPHVDAVDVASYQSWMTQANFNQLKQKGVKTAIVKLTQGTGYVNPYATNQIKYAKNAGLGAAVYHYALFNSAASAKGEANWMVKELKSHGLAKNTRIFADMEAESTNVGSVGSNLNQFWATLSAAGYTNHAVYTGGSYGKTYANATADTVGHDKTWYAAYPYTPTAGMTLKSFKGFDYGAWQFSSTAYISGTSDDSIDASHDYSGVLTNLASTNLTSAPQGPWLEKSGYIKIKYATDNFWSDFDFKKSISTKTYQGQELVVNGMYHHTNGTTYYSVYTKAGKWLGYLDANAATWEGPQGAWHADDRYVTITGNYDVYGDFNFVTRYAAGTLKGQTFHSTGKYYHIGGGTYLSLVRSDGSWVGYINQDAVKETTKAGAWQPVNGYVTFSSAKQPAYGDLQDKGILTSAAKLNGHTYKVTGKYVAFDGKVRYSISNNTNKWVGYVNAAGLKLTSTGQGIWHADNRYVTITNNYDIYGDFNFITRYPAGKFTSQTFRSTGKYYHFGGGTYLSLEKNDGTWLGYINQDAVQQTTVDGAWQPAKGYVTIDSAKAAAYHDLQDKTVQTSGAKLNGHTYKITGKYVAFNGKVRYSVYTNANKWLGYVDASSVKYATGAEGAWLADNRNVTITGNYDVYGNFNFITRYAAGKLKGQKFRSTGKYYHNGGGTYLSLYKSNGVWLGYINQNAVR